MILIPNDINDVRVRKGCDLFDGFCGARIELKQLYKVAVFIAKASSNNKLDIS
jgi:hypothetical protein